MKKTILSAAAAVAVILLSASFAAAQTAAAKAPADPAKVRAEIEKAVEALRTDARAGKSDILGKTMKLDSAQAAAFWPLYKQYEAELATVNNDRLAIIQDRDLAQRMGRESLAIVGEHAETRTFDQYEKLYQQTVAALSQR